MVYIKGLDIKSYRGIANLNIKDFSDINIITGDNNCGKTSLLEIVKSISYPMELSNWITAARKRDIFGLSIYESIKAIFPVNADEKKVEIVVCDKDTDYHTITVTASEQIEILSDKEIEKLKSSRLNTNQERLLENEDDIARNVEVKSMQLLFRVVNENGEEDTNQETVYDFSRRMTSPTEPKLVFYKTTYIAPFEHTFNSFYLKDVLSNSDMYVEMLDVLKDFDEDIININSFAEGRDTIFAITSKKNNEALPLNVYGDGMKKVLLLMSAIVKSKDGILLVDEFETSIHTSGLNTVFNWVVKTCKKLNVQLFVTTHSEEAIDKLLNSSTEALNSIRVITLYKKENQTVARVLDGEKALDAKNTFGLELR